MDDDHYGYDMRLAQKKESEEHHKHIGASVPVDDELSENCNSDPTAPTNKC